jgi:hypothetical protein
LSSVVLRELGISVALHIEAGAFERWYFVRESGRIPEGYERAETRVSPRGYVVIVRGTCLDPQVIVAELTEDSMWKAKHRVVPAMSVEELWGDTIHSCEGGLFSSGRECGCEPARWAYEDSRCQDCRRVPRESRLFVEAYSFKGVCPLGEDHWWRGVTDAVGARNADVFGHGHDRWFCPRVIDGFARG